MFVDICYAGFCLAAAPYACLRSAADGGFRNALVERLVPRLPVMPAPSVGVTRVWVHGVSVGEVLAARLLVESLLGKRGNLHERGFSSSACEVVFSATTPAGASVARSTFADVPVFFFPFDFSHNVRACFAAIRPSVVVLMEQELWPNFLEVASQLSVPVLVVNGRMTEKAQRKYGYIRGLARTMMRRLALVCALDEEHARRFLSCGADPRRLVITGNMKYDGFRSAAPSDADANASARAYYRELAGITPSDTLIVGGSTHAPEEEWLLNAVVRLKSQVAGMRLLIAPRHVQRVAEVEKAVSSVGFAPVRRSSLGPPVARDAVSPPTGEDMPVRAEGRDGISRYVPDLHDRSRQVLILDTVGELRNVYPAADIVFIGGSLIPHGGQNVLEPAMACKPVVFGPHMFNFSEAAELLREAGAAIVAADPGDLARALGVFAGDATRAATAGAAGAGAVRRKQGATDRNLNAIAAMLNARRCGSSTRMCFVGGS
jgi:3-deoxy-D-manno-octulosonic-acid transferase